MLLKDLNPGSSSSTPQWLTALNGNLFFTATDGSNGLVLWKSDGTTAGTELLREVAANLPIRSPRYLTVVNNVFYFSAIDYAYGQELWKSDGTTA